MYCLVVSPVMTYLYKINTVVNYSVYVYVCNIIIAILVVYPQKNIKKKIYKANNRSSGHIGSIIGFQPENSSEFGIHFSVLHRRNKQPLFLSQKPEQHLTIQYKHAIILFMFVQGIVVGRFSANKCRLWQFIG